MSIVQGDYIIQRHFFSTTTIMGKLNIAHHKSYHPYRRDNIERVKKDEEEAQLEEAKAEGKMMLAVSPTSLKLPV